MRSRALKRTLRSHRVDDQLVTQLVTRQRRMQVSLVTCQRECESPTCLLRHVLSGRVDCVLVFNGDARLVLA